MKLAVISDIHGNLEAFNSFLDTVGDYSVCICLGDLVDYGPRPKQVIKAVSEHADFIVMGNHDLAVATGVDCGCSYHMKELSIKTREFTVNSLDKEDVDSLKQLAKEKFLNFDGRRTYIVHASKSDPFYRYLLPKTRDSELIYEFEDTRADLVLAGHTHFPMVRQLRDLLFVNPGSLGQPRDGDPRASYAVIDGDNVEIRRVEYDIEKEAAEIMRTGLEDKVKAKLIEILRHGGLENG